MANIVFIDNFDSFTYNLVDQLRVLGHQVKIYQNDCNLNYLNQQIETTADCILVLSPGPSTPEQAGNLLPLIKQQFRKVPILGICLGHQALIQALGGEVVNANAVLHGKVSLISHDNKFMFEGLKNPMPVARYHSLMGVNISQDFIVNATFDDIAMAIRHKNLPICSFQFHPESILTVEGVKLLRQSVEWLSSSFSNHA